MCGIAGVVHFDTRTTTETVVARMTDTLIHRGPDESGLYLSRTRKVGLGTRRLAILDLSATGHLPMSDASGRVWLTYNGEIYNFRELRRQLEVKGYRPPIEW